MASKRDTAAVAEAAYVFGYPLLLSARAMRDANRLFVGPVTANTRRIRGWLDLGSEPWVLSVPDTIGRYSVVSLRDAWRNAFASLGARTTGADARAFAILGPGQHGLRLPVGLSPIVSPTRIVRVTGCVEASTDAGVEFTDGIRLTPLSRWARPDDGAAPTSVGRTPDEGTTAVDEIERLGAHDFLSELLRLTADNPPGPADADMLAQVRVLAAEGPSEALQQLVRQGREAVRSAAPVAAGGGWRVGYDAGRYERDDLRRAAAARVDLDAELATDELPAVVETDADGHRLTGRERYVLRFPEHEIPPVHAFWCLSTAAGSISDLQGLVLDADGALTIRIRRQPSTRWGANCLLAPADGFALELRLYWPHQDAIEGRWSPPPVTRVA